MSPTLTLSLSPNEGIQPMIRTRRHHPSALPKESKNLAKTAQYSHRRIEFPEHGLV